MTDITDDKLCDVGNILWEGTYGFNYSDDIYKKYVDHIKQCKVCQKGLVMTDKDIELLNDFETHKELFVPVEIVE